MNDVMQYLPKIEMPLPISNSVGHFKHVLNGKIIQFSSLGPKNYIISYLTNKDVVNVYSKVRGLSLISSHNKDQISNDLYNNYIDAYFDNMRCAKAVNQLQIKRSKKLFPIPELELRSVTNEIKTHRIVIKNDIFSSIPYGFKA